MDTNRNRAPQQGPRGVRYALLGAVLSVFGCIWSFTNPAGTTWVASIAFGMAAVCWMRHRRANREDRR